MSNKITDNWQKYLRENKKVEEKFAPDDFKDVYNTARMAHVGQTRRDGSEYFSHPSEVSNIATRYYPKDHVVRLAAYLHDTLEDAPGATVSSKEEMEDFIRGSIQDPDSADEVIRVVRALTHEKGGDYQSYVLDLLGDVPTLRVKLADMVHNLTDNPSPKQKAKYKLALDAIAQKTGGNPPKGISDKHWNTLMSLSSDKVDEAVLSMDDMDALNDKVDEFGYTKEGLYELVIKVFQAMDSGDVSKILSQLKKTNEEASIADVVGHVAEKILDKEDGEYQRSIVKPIKMKEEEELDEKAVSKAQQRFMGAVKGCKETGDCASPEIKKAADSMTDKEVDDFAGTKHKGLPNKVKKEELRKRIRETIIRKLGGNDISEAVKYHLENKLPVSQNIFRPGSDQFFALFKEVRKLHNEGKYELHESEEYYILETSDLGEWGVYEGNKVPLDYPFLYEDEELEEAKYQGREVTLGAKGAKRSGDGRAYVYVRDPQSGKIRKVSFGSSMPDAMGDSEAARKRRKNFGDRHDCANKKDKTKAGYWACRATKMFGRDISGWW